MNAGAPGHAVPADVAWTSGMDDDGVTRVFVARLPHGPIEVLEGSAAVIWLAAIEGESSTVVDRVAAAVDLSVEAVSEDIRTFVADLVRRGLLVAA